MSNVQKTPASMNLIVRLPGYVKQTLPLWVRTARLHDVGYDPLVVYRGDDGKNTIRNITGEVVARVYTLGRKDLYYSVRAELIRVSTCADYNSTQAVDQYLYGAFRMTLLALVAYDDCDRYLQMSYDELQVWAKLSEQPQAVLLLPLKWVQEHEHEALVASA